VATPEDLLPAVLAAPDDDLPRLVYADALEETGNSSDIARAEFIRVQIELTRTPGRVDLVAREAALLAVHGEKWLAPLRAKGEALESKSTHGQFRRGFVEVVWMPAKIFIRRALSLFVQSPARELRVTQISVADLRALCDCAYLTHLKVLDLSDMKIGDAGIFAISSRPLPHLRILRLRACNIVYQGVVNFWARKFRDEWSLEELDLTLNALDRSAVENLLAIFGNGVVKHDAPTDSTPSPPDR
jgi:uncharacterized protein (TIGR02996 family)